jgi:hypothetical protein
MRPNQDGIALELNRSKDEEVTTNDIRTVFAVPMNSSEVNEDVAKYIIVVIAATKIEKVTTSGTVFRNERNRSMCMAISIPITKNRM